MTTLDHTVATNRSTVAVHPAADGCLKIFHQHHITNYFLSGQNCGLKHHFLYLYGGHFENVAYMQLFDIIFGFLDPENMGIDTKIVFLSDLEANILPKT